MLPRNVRNSWNVWLSRGWHTCQTQRQVEMVTCDIFWTTGPPSYFPPSAISHCQQRPPQDGVGVHVHACVRVCACVCVHTAGSDLAWYLTEWLGLGLTRETGRQAVAAAVFGSSVCFHFWAKGIIVRNKILPWIYSVLGYFADATRKEAN